MIETSGLEQRTAKGEKEREEGRRKKEEEADREESALTIDSLATSPIYGIYPPVLSTF